MDRDGGETMRSIEVTCNVVKDSATSKMVTAQWKNATDGTLYAVAASSTLTAAINKVRLVLRQPGKSE